MLPGDTAARSRIGETDRKPLATHHLRRMIAAAARLDPSVWFDNLEVLVSQPLALLLLFAAGTIAGTINVLAGGGSFLTLPLLIFLGLPPTVANGTNRIAILVQNVGAVWSFNRHGVMDWSWIRRAALPALAGAGLGTWAAVRIDDASFQRILASLMVVFAVVILLDPLRNRIRKATGIGDDPTADRAAQPRLSGAAFSATFFAVGVYGGFVQAGVGFFILALAMLAGFDLVRGNALKVLVVLVFTPLALVPVRDGRQGGLGHGNRARRRQPPGRTDRDPPHGAQGPRVGEARGRGDDRGVRPEAVDRAVAGLYFAPPSGSSSSSVSPYTSANEVRRSDSTVRLINP